MDILPYEDVEEICLKLDNRSLSRLMNTSKTMRNFCMREMGMRIREILGRVEVNIQLHIGTNDGWKTIGLEDYYAYVGDKLHEEDVTRDEDHNFIDLQNYFTLTKYFGYSERNRELAILMYEAAKRNKNVVFGINIDQQEITFAEFGDLRLQLNEMGTTHQIEVPISIGFYEVRKPKKRMFEEITYRKIPLNQIL